MKKVVAWFMLFMIILLLVLVMTSNAQIYSAQASKEVVAIVQKEEPMVKVDTVKITDRFGFPSLYVIKNSLTYPKVILLLVKSPEGEWVMRAYTRQGQQVILRSEDEYLILEKIFANQK